MLSPSQTGEAALRAAGFRGRITSEASLAPHTTWMIGGPAEILAVPRDPDDLMTAVHWATDSGTPWRILGNGSNLLIHDNGVRGLVLQVRKVLDDIEQQGQRLRAGAGAGYPSLANLAAAAGLSGLEFAAGIPGTVGGAIVMNAGWHEHETGQLVESVAYLEENGTLRTYTREMCAFGYRNSVFRGRHGVVLEATFHLQPGAPSRIQENLVRYAASRRESQPTDRPSCGSVFLKPPGDFAGRLIDQAGLKGLRVGNIQVSRKHANFFINLGGGTFDEALALIQQVETEVWKAFGVLLIREVEIWE